MMNGSNHRFTYSQVRQVGRRARWRRSGRTGEGFEEHEVLRRERPLHPAFRRRRRKHPAYYSIRYIRSGRIRVHKTAAERFSEPITMRAGGLSRTRRHTGLRLWGKTFNGVA